MQQEHTNIFISPQPDALYEEQSQHNHPKDEIQYTNVKFRRRLEETIAKNPRSGIRDIFDQVLAAMG
jgi:hypothetical protein